MPEKSFRQTLFLNLKTAERGNFVGTIINGGLTEQKMKKLKVLMTAVLAVATAAACFTAVGCKKDKHQHTFSTRWETSDTHHWHKATCEHTDEQGDYGAHDYDENYKCKVCKYQHEHKYDANYKCTVCGYQHNHTYENTWSSNDSYHWYEASCGHSDTVNRISHDLDNDYKCKICGHQLVETGVMIAKKTVEYVLNGSTTANIDLSDLEVSKLSQGGIAMGKLDAGNYTLSYYKGKEEVTAESLAQATEGAYNIWVKSTLNGKQTESFVIVYVLDNITKIEMTEGETTQVKGPTNIIKPTWKFRVTYASGATKDLTADEVKIEGLTVAVAKEATATVSYTDVNAKGVSTTVSVKVNYTVTAE